MPASFDWSALESALSNVDFGSKAWLTFYLNADPARLHLICKDLSELDAVNLEGSEGGFVYAKIPVELTKKKIANAIASVRQLAGNYKVDIDLIDLDSSSGVGISTFYTLWKNNNAQTH